MLVKPPRRANSIHASVSFAAKSANKYEPRFSAAPSAQGPPAVDFGTFSFSAIARNAGIKHSRGPATKPMRCPSRPCSAVVPARNCGAGPWNDVSTSSPRLRRHTPDASSDASPARGPRYSFGAGEIWKNVKRCASGTSRAAAVTVK